MSTKQAYEQKLKAQLDEWDAEIKKLEAQARQASADEKLKQQEQLNDARSKHEQTRKKLDELQASSEQSWEDIKVGADRAWTELKDTMESVRKRFR